MTTFEEELARTGWLAYTNVGVSMLPLIREGRDVLVIQRRDPAEVRKYDAVLFRRPGVQGRGRYVLHRVLKRYPDGQFWIVGDNCVYGEDVRPEDVLGVMTKLNRGGKIVQPTDFGYRVYMALWCAPWPLRFAVLRGQRFARRIAGAVKRRVLRR